jgi:hypothetical protein
MVKGSFQRLKDPGRGVYYPPPSSVEYKEGVEVICDFMVTSRVELLVYIG